MRKLKLTLMIGTILTAWNVQADCVTPPDCAELGFTSDASTCAGPALKCPWDITKAACDGEESTPRFPAPVLYGDGTVSNELIPDKTPIGIVFDLDKRLAVALADVGQDMIWSGNNVNIPSMPRCEYSDYGSTQVYSCGTDGRANTNALLACSSCGGTPAATACNNYEPSGCTTAFCKKTKWFLPSMAEWKKIWDKSSQIKTGLELLSGKGASLFATKRYWSSTEYNKGFAWLSDSSGTTVFNAKGVKGSNAVRAILKY